MKQTKLALSAVMIVAIGLTGANFVTGSEMTEQEKINAYVDSAPVYGHITIVHSDPDGNILSYIQTDNVVTAEGKNCMADQIFGEVSSGCIAVGNTAFNTIGLFDTVTFANTDTDVTLSPSLLTNAAFAGLGITVADSVTLATAASGATGATVDIVELFTAGTGVTSKTVTGAALYNDAEDALFAGQAFGASVVLNDADTLSVTWSITLG